MPVERQRGAGRERGRRHQSEPEQQGESHQNQHVLAQGLYPRRASASQVNPAGEEQRRAVVNQHPQ
jgi:hypothetical protein